MYKKLPFYTLVIICSSIIACNVNNEREGGVAHPPHPQGPSFYEAPRWSPDGNSILYYSYGVTSFNPDSDPLQWTENPDSAGIWLLDIHSGKKRKILNARYADWSPDQEWIVFEANRIIYKIRYNGQNAVDSTLTLLNSFSGGVVYPEWSPDGSKIAFKKIVPDSIGKGGIWVMNSDGSDPRFIFSTGSAPTWNKESLLIAFVFDRQLHLFNIKSDQIIESITLGGVSHRYPKFSPFSDKKIAFGTDGTITVLNLESKESIELHSGEYPDWHPSGESIVYQAGQIVRTNPDGSNREILVELPEPN